MKCKRLILVAAMAGSFAWQEAGATLTNFDDYGLDSVTASWDIFYGANYLPTFEFSTGTVGNPILNSAEPLTLRAVVTTYVPGPPAPANQQATGPIGSDQSIPGDRDQFYTFFAGNIDWDISGTTAAAWTTFVFQANIGTGSGSSLTNVRLNGLTATDAVFDGGHATWQWTGLSLDNGDAFALTWNTGTHTGLDAFQIQAGVVPEPGTVGMLLAGWAWLAGQSRKRRSRK